jgi:hypothetical protein
MPIQIVEYTARERAAALAFNERMRKAHAPTDFLLPDLPAGNNGAGAPDGSVRWTNFLALDEASEARGGFLLMELTGWLNGRTVPVANYQAPLSEGICDSRFGLVGMHMLKFVQRRAPHTFVVGMGAPDRPLPRLLAAAGWSVTAVPFFCRVVNPSRVLQGLPMFRQPKHLDLATRLAAKSGAAWAGIGLLQAKGLLERRHARHLQATRIVRWEPWADALWVSVRHGYSFAAVRDRAALERLYPLDDPRYLAYAVSHEKRTIGWTVALKTTMRDDRHFGNLTVVTILDAVAQPGFAAPLLSCIVDHIAPGADVVVTNQSHEVWQDACRRSGFLRGPSNFLFAASKPLAEAIAAAGPTRVHIVRGDGDGRIHL